jgi:excisionase family DNA binding protein
VKEDSVNAVELLTIQEAAILLKLKVSRLRKAVFRREVKHVKLGALIRFKREHLTEWIERQTIGSAA